MLHRSLESSAVLGPEQISELSVLHDETVALLAREDGPYASVDRATLSLEVARALIDAARKGTNEPAAMERAVLLRLSEEFGNAKRARWD